MRALSSCLSLSSRAVGLVVALLLVAVGVIADVETPSGQAPAVPLTPAEQFDKVFMQGGLTADEVNARMVDAFERLPPEQKTAEFLLERFRKSGSRAELFTHPKNVEPLMEKLSREEQRKLLAGFQELAPAHEKREGYRVENSFRDYADEMTLNYLRKTPDFEDTSEGNADFELAKKYWMEGKGKIWKGEEATFKDVPPKVYGQFVQRVMGMNFVMTDSTGNDLTGTFGTYKGIQLRETDNGWVLSNPPSGAYIESRRGADGKPGSKLPVGAVVTALKGEPLDGGLSIMIPGDVPTSIRVTGELAGTIATNDKGSIVYQGSDRSIILSTSLGGEIQIDSSSFFEGEGEDSKLRSDVLTIYDRGRKVAVIEGKGYTARYDQTASEFEGENYVGTVTVERSVKDGEGKLSEQTITARLREGGSVLIRDPDKTVAFIDGELKRRNPSSDSIRELTKEVLQSIDASVEFENAHVTVVQDRNVAYADSTGRGTLVLVTPKKEFQDVVRAREFLEQFFTSKSLTGSTAELIERAKQDRARYEQYGAALKKAWDSMSTGEKIKNAGAMARDVGQQVNRLWQRLGEYSDSMGLKDYTDATGKTITKQAQLVGLLDGITEGMLTNEIRGVLAAGDVYLGAGGVAGAVQKGGPLVAKALGIDRAVVDTLGQLADPTGDALQEARIAATRPGSTTKINLELVKEIEPRTFIVASLGAEKPVAQGRATGDSAILFGVAQTTQTIADPTKTQFETYQEATVSHSSAVVGWSSSEPSIVWSKPPTKEQKHDPKLDPVVYLEKDTRSSATIETKSGKNNAVESSTMSTRVVEKPVVTEDGKPVYLKDPTGKAIMRRNADGVLEGVVEKRPAYDVELKSSREKTGLPATVQFLDPVTRSTSTVGIHVQDGMLSFGFEKKDEFSRAGVDGKVVAEEKRISYSLADAYLTFDPAGRLQAVAGDPDRSAKTKGSFKYTATEDGKEVLGAEVPTLNAVVTLERLNVLDPSGPLVISIKPREQSGRLVPLNERDGGLEPIIFRVKGYESSALVPLTTEDSSIEVGSAGVSVNLRAAQVGGKGTLVVMKDSKKQFEADVEDFLFGLTLEPKGDAFQLTNSFVFTPAEEGVQFVPLLGGGTKGKQRISTLVEKGLDTDEMSPMEVVTVTLEGINDGKDKGGNGQGVLPVFAQVRYAGSAVDVAASEGVTIVMPQKQVVIGGKRKDETAGGVSGVYLPFNLHYDTRTGDFLIDGRDIYYMWLTEAQKQQYDTTKGNAWQASVAPVKEIFLAGNLKQLETEAERAYRDLMDARREADRMKAQKYHLLPKSKSQYQQWLAMENKARASAEALANAMRSVKGVVQYGGEGLPLVDMVLWGQTSLSSLTVGSTLTLGGALSEVLAGDLTTQVVQVKPQRGKTAFAELVSDSTGESHLVSKITSVFDPSRLPSFLGGWTLRESTFGGLSTRYNVFFYDEKLARQFLDEAYGTIGTQYTLGVRASVQARLLRHPLLQNLPINERKKHVDQIMTSLDEIFIPASEREENKRGVKRERR